MRQAPTRRRQAFLRVPEDSVPAAPPTARATRGCEVGFLAVPPKRTGSGATCGRSGRKTNRATSAVFQGTDARGSEGGAKPSTEAIEQTAPNLMSAGAVAVHFFFAGAAFAGAAFAGAAFAGAAFAGAAFAGAAFAGAAFAGAAFAGAAFAGAAFAGAVFAGAAFAGAVFAGAAFAGAAFAGAAFAGAAFAGAVFAGAVFAGAVFAGAGLG